MARRSRKTDEVVENVLYAWGRYVIAGNRFPGPPVTSRIAERIGKGAYGGDSAPEVDERVIWFDGIYKALPERYKVVLWAEYTLPGPQKVKIAELKWTNTDYGAALAFAREEVGRRYYERFPGNKVIADECAIR